MFLTAYTGGLESTTSGGTINQVPCKRRRALSAVQFLKSSPWAAVQAKLYIKTDIFTVSIYRAISFLSHGTYLSLGICTHVREISECWKWMSSETWLPEECGCTVQNGLIWRKYSCVALTCHVSLTFFRQTSSVNVCIVIWCWGCTSQYVTKVVRHSMLLRLHVTVCC